MKTTMKILAVLLIAITLVTFSTNVFASTTKGIDAKDLKETYANDDGGLKAKAGSIMGLIRNVSVIASVIVIMVLGVKYILGSVEEKADYKKAFMPLIIGIILVVSATSIAAFIFNMAK